MVRCGIVVSCVVCLVHCGYSLFAFPSQKLLIKKKGTKRGQKKKSFCKEIEENLVINSEVACH